jgi:hypothetical protein
VTGIEILWRSVYREEGGQFWETEKCETSGWLA